MHPWAAVFDWDGVIIDSSRQHAASWERLAQLERRALPVGHFQRSFGMKSARIFPEVLRWTTDPVEIKRLSRFKEELYREIVRESGIQVLPGVKTFLDRLRAAAVPAVIGSSTSHENIEFVIHLVGLDDYFNDIVAADDVTHGKPDPEVFLIAARKLGVLPRDCVVFEDAHVGLEAARAAGMKVVGVATMHPADSLQDADRVVERLDELTAEEIAGWF